MVAWFGPRQRGLALGLRHMSTPLGGAVAAALLPLAAARGGLSATLLALSGACLVGAAAAVAQAVSAGEADKAAALERALADAGAAGTALVAWVAAGVLVGLASLAYGELGAAMPCAGGDAEYLLQAYGEPAAFLFVW